ASLYDLPLLHLSRHPPHLPSFPTRRSSDLPPCPPASCSPGRSGAAWSGGGPAAPPPRGSRRTPDRPRRPRGSCGPSCRCRSSSRSEEHTSELQSLTNIVCRLLLEKKNNACP